MVRLIVGTLAGGLVGYGWYALVGCRCGACHITSNPVSSVIFGAVMGFIVAMR